MIIEILQHTIEYNWFEDGFNTHYVNGIDINHIKHEIEVGNNQGELCQLFTDIDKNDKPFDHELRGWWKIIK